MILKLPKNTQGRDYIIGDLHGCYRQLMDSLRALSFDTAKDRLIAVGDLIDRGPESLGCLKLLNEPWFFSVMGNHEQFLIEGLVYNNVSSISIWMRNGGDWRTRLYDEQHEELAALLPKIQAMPLAIEIDGRVGVVHAEVPLAIWDEQQWRMRHADPLSILLWSRTKVNYNMDFRIEGIDYVVSGHTPVKGPKWLGNQLFLDTGAGKDDKLSFAVVTDEGVEIL